MSCIADAKLEARDGLPVHAPACSQVESLGSCNTEDFSCMTRTEAAVSRASERGVHPPLWLKSSNNVTWSVTASAVRPLSALRAASARSRSPRSRVWRCDREHREVWLLGGRFGELRRFDQECRQPKEILTVRTAYSYHYWATGGAASAACPGRVDGTCMRGWWSAGVCWRADDGEVSQWQCAVAYCTLV